MVFNFFLFLLFIVNLFEILFITFYLFIIIFLFIHYLFFSSSPFVYLWSALRWVDLPAVPLVMYMIYYKRHTVGYTVYVLDKIYLILPDNNAVSIKFLIYFHRFNWYWEKNNLLNLICFFLNITSDFCNGQNSEESFIIQQHAYM